MFDDIMHELVPEGDGRFNLGEVLLFAFTVILAVFTAFRSYDFINHTLPPGWELVAYAGLAVMDGGFLVWALVIALSATSAVQVAISWGMWLADGLGLALVVVADSFYYTQASQNTAAMADTVSALAAWAFPIMAIVNAAFAILYKLMEPKRIRERQKRAKMERLHHLAELGELQARIEQVQATVASRLTDQRMSLADLKGAMAEKLAELERLEKELALRRIQQAQLNAGTAGQPTKPTPAVHQVAPVTAAVPGDNHNEHRGDFTTLEGVSPFGE